ncbi:MAG: GAF domain-containing protein [Anaerolineae bacterium]|nr:GAF domain-containing protein [Anaerolineae bacterium]
MSKTADELNLFEGDRLLQLSGCFTFSMDEEQILIAVLRELSDAEIDRCVISVFEDVDDRDPEWMQVVAVYDRASSEMGLSSSPNTISMSEMPVVQRLLREKEPIVIANVRREADISGVSRGRLWLHDMQTVAIVPLIVMGWPIGMLIVGRKEPADFSVADLRFYQIVANLAATALRSVHLIEQQNRRVAEQNAINRVGKAVSSVLHLDELLEQVYLQTNTVIDAENFFIALYDPFHEEVSFPFIVENGQRAHFADREASRGLTGYILSTRQPLLLANRVLERMEEMGIEVIGAEALSWIGAPMIVADQVVGVMAAQNHQRENVYTPSDLELLAALANQVGIAIENARLYEETERQAVYLRLSAQVGRRIILILDIDELLSQVVTLIRESFGYYHVQVALIDEATSRVVYRAGSSENRTLMSDDLPRVQVGQEGIIGWVAAYGEPVLVNDVHQDQRYLHVDALPDTRSELAIPIKFGGKVIGVLDIESEVRNAFHPQDIPTMYTLADQIAIAVENARLFGEQERRIRELDVLVNVGRSLCNVTHLSQLWSLVYEQLGTLIDVSNFFIAVYYPENETVRLDLVYDEGHRLEPFTLHYDAGEGLTSWVIENKRPLLIQDWLADDLGLAGRVVERGTLETRSWLGVPILRCDRVLGVIGVQSAIPRVFDERHRMILSIVAAQLAMALDSIESQDRGD